MPDLGNIGSQDENAFNIGNFYPNAFFDYLSRLMPRKLKTLFRWLEYLYVNCGQTFSVIKKMSEYPITSLTFDTDDIELEKRLQHIHGKHLKTKQVAIQVGIDYFVYGNSFTSLFKPFTRYLVCKECKQKHNALNWPYEWMPQKFQFKIKCSSCKHHGVAALKHEKLKDVKKLKVVRWDPKDIDLNWNPVTGEIEYYYNIGNETKSRIRSKKPDKFLINTMPWEIMETIRDKKIFKFRAGQIYHLKNPAPAGLNQEWGYPGLLGSMKPFFYTAILRKGNEATALERLVPWRILHPQATSANNDPAQYVNLNKWRNEMQDAIRKWRRDPNMIKLAPIPVGVTEIGGNARPLLTHQEIAQTEQNIITSMGVPKEFVEGGLTHAGGSVTLRMLENQLFTYTEQIVEFLQWLNDQLCSYEGLTKVQVDMVPFKLVDDIQQKQLLGQLYERQEVSAKSFMKALDLDPELERQYIMEEQLAKARMEKELQQKLRKIEENLASQTDAQLGGNPLNYDPNMVMQIAEEEAMNQLNMPQEDRNARMEQIKMQDPVLASVIKDAFSMLQKQQKEQGMAMMQQQGNGGMQGMGGISPENMSGASPSTSAMGG